MLQFSQDFSARGGITVFTVKSIFKMFTFFLTFCSNEWKILFCLQVSLFSGPPCIGGNVIYELVCGIYELVLS